MRILYILPVLAIVALGGCARDGGRAYAGSPGSTYDAAGNPAQARGAATYNANSPLMPHDYGNGGTGGGVR